MTTYRTSPLAADAPQTAEVLDRWGGHTMGGRVPAFLGLAQRTGGIFYENPESVADGVRQAGLDFDVKLESLHTSVPEPIIGDDGPTTIARTFDLPNHRATVAHYEDGRIVPFGPVGTKYRPIQNTVAAELGQALVDGGDGSLLAIGTYGEPVGARTYMAFDLGDFTVGGGDPHNLALTITNSHDGSSGLVSLVAPLRLACTNQTSGIFGKRNSARHVIRHTESATGRVAEMRVILGMTRNYVELYQAQSEDLLAHPMSTDDFVEWERDLFGAPDDLANATKHTRTLTEKRDETLIRLYRDSATNEFGRGTAFAAAQSVIEYLDHESLTRGRGRDPEVGRWERIMAGQTENAKARTWSSLLAIA